MSYAEALSKISEIQARIAEIDPRQAQVADPAAFADALQAAVGNSPAYGSQAARDPLDPLNPTATTAVATASAAPVAVTGDAGGATQYDGMILEAARAQGVDPALLKALVRAESNFDPNAVSHAGAQGLTQLMPATAAGFGVTNPFDPMQSLNAGARFLHNSLAMFNGDPSLALAAYNAGPGAVQKYGGIPPYSETQAYVPKVLAYYDQYRAQGFGGPPPTLSAVATGPTPVAPQQAGASSPAAAQALGAAQRQLGTPYVWAGEQPGGFDCSGLMQWAYGQQGVQIPRVAADQARAGQAVPRDQLAPGDLVYFADSSGYVHHIGMYVGGDKFLHAPHTGDVVKISSLSESHYAREYAGARRVA